MPSRGTKGEATGGNGVALGITLGVALGAATDNIGAGIAIGIAIGASLDAVKQIRKPSTGRIDKN